MGLYDTFFSKTPPASNGRATSQPSADDDDDTLPPPSFAVPAQSAQAQAARPPGGALTTPPAAVQPADDDATDPSPNAAPSFAVPAAPRPGNRFNYTQFSQNPGLAEMFAPEIAQEQRAQAQDAANAKADAAANARQHNADMTRQAQLSGMRTVRDGDGLLQPLQDDQGRTLYHPNTGAVQYNPDGTPFQESRDQFGNLTRANPDANAPVGPNTDDPSDPQLYRQNKYQGWQPIGHVDDLASDTKQPADVRKAAQGWQKERGKLIGQAAVQTADRLHAQAQAEHMGAESEINSLTTQNTALQQQLDALDADPNANQTAGGFLGMGSHPTDAAANLAARRADLEKQQGEIQAQLGAVRAQVPTLKAKMEAAAADASITRHGLDLSNYSTLADQRRAILKTEGKPEQGDQTLAAIEAKQAELNVKLTAAREQRAALPPMSSSGDAPAGSPAPSPASSTPGPADPSPAGTPAAASPAPIPPAGAPTATVASPSPSPDQNPLAPAGQASSSPAPKPTAGQRAKNDAAQVAAGVLNTPFDAGRAFWLSAAAATDVPTPQERNQENQQHVAELQSTLADFVKRKANPRYKSDPNFRLNVDDAIKRTQASIAQRQNTPPEQPLSPGDEKKAQFFRDLSTQSRAYADDEKSTTERVKANVGVDPKQAGNTDSRIFAGLGALPKILIPGGIGPVLMLGDTKSSAYDAEMAKLQPQVDSGAMPAHDAERAADTASTVKTLEQLPTLAAYGLNGKLASTAVKSILARTQISSPLWRAAAEGAGALAANVTTSTGVRATEAALSDDPKAWDNVLPSWESLFSGDLPFALIHGGHALGEGRARNAAVAEGQAHLNAQAARLAPITPATAEEHVAVPLRPGTPDADQANAAVAANFAARNPDAPKIDPAVVAKAREFAPVGEEQATGVALQAADQQIEGLESGLAAIPAGDPQRRIEQQAKLAQAYQSKAALVNQQDARLLAVQQISALPDWQPPVDPTTRQPTEAPDPNRDRETAGALLKLANGFSPDDLTSAEQARLKGGKNAPTLTRKAPDGSTILTDAGRQALATASPASQTFIQGTEAQDLRSRAQQQQADEDTASSESASEAGQEEAQKDEASTSTSQPPPLADRILGRLRQQVTDSGKTLTPEQDQAAQQYAGKAADHITTALDRYKRAFKSVGLDVVHEPEEGSGGAYSPGPGEIRLSLDDIIHPDNLRALQDPARADRMVQEEAVHAVGQHLEEQWRQERLTAQRENRPPDKTKEFNPTAVWESLPPVLQKRVQSVYSGDNARNMGHETLRMLVQGRLNMSRDGWVMDGHLISEQTDPGLMQRARQSVFKLFKFFQDLHGSLVRAGAHPKDAEMVAQTVERLHKVVRGVIDQSGKNPDGMGDGERATASENPAGGTGSEPEQPARSRAGDARRAPEESPAPAAEAEVQRTPTDDERQRAAAGLGIDPVHVGHVSEVTSSTGQRVRTAYVAREAAETRPSHTPDGAVTPDYPQDFQPRDRSGAAYRRQAQNIAGDLDLDRLAGSARPDEGSPIVTGAGHTLTGNGRDIATGLSYREGYPAAAKYRASLIQRAPEFGLDRAAVARLKQPVLQRVILGHESPEALRRFSEDSNASPAMGSNALETAGQDAKRLTPALLSLFDPNYSLESAKNGDFLKAFGQQVILGRTRVGEGSANELNLSPADLGRRARLALFAAAYGGDTTGRSALERMGGDTEDNGRNISQALLTLAPVMARLRVDTAAGEMQGNYDISAPLVRAAQDISEAVASKPPKQSAGAAIDGLLAQQTFDADPLERAALGFFARNRSNRTALEEGLSNFVESAYGLGNPKHGADMFGERQMPTPLELFLKATNPALNAQRATARAGAAESLRQILRSRPAESLTDGEIDPRLKTAFGEDWKAGYDALGLPRFPLTLEDQGRAALAMPTMEADRPESLPVTGTIHADSPLAKLYPGVAGKTIPRSALHSLILNHFLKEGRTKSSTGEKVAWLSGGGGGAGKSTILKHLERDGIFSKEGKVSINADDIKELLPEYHDIAAAGDSRAAGVVHEESSYLAKQLQQRALDAGHDILFDGTLANQRKSLALIQKLKDAGYTVNLAAVTIKPYEALVRAMTRARHSGRYVPVRDLMQAHRGFNAALPELVRAADAAAVYDNSGADAVKIPVAQVLDGTYAQINGRSKLDPDAPSRAAFEASYEGPASRGLQGDTRDDGTSASGSGSGRSEEDAAQGVHSVSQPGLNSRRATRDPNQQDFFSSLGARDTAAKYAETLPSAAKVNRPTLEREATKDLPELKGNDAALGELFAHAHRSLTGKEPAVTNDEDANRNDPSAGPGVRGAGEPDAAGIASTAPGSANLRRSRARPVPADGQSNLFGSGQPGSERGGDDGRSAPATGGVGVESAEPERAGQPVGSSADAQRSGGSAGVSSDGARPTDVAPAARELAPEERNHRIGDDEAEVAPRGNPGKFRANLDAISLLRRLESENRNATPEEKKVLAKYTGWGWAGEYFNPANPRYAAEHAQLRGVMSDAEFRAAAASTTNAHFTSPRVIRSMWKMAERLGFKGGKVLEPAGGVGHFFGLMPEGLEKRSQLEGVELDKLSARMMQKLYPQAKVFQGGFEESRIPNNSLDLAISNVPFGNYKLAKAEDYPNLLIHDYFFARSLDKVKPGGLVLFVTSDGTMDKADPSTRRLLAEKADLVGAVRLPNDAFAANAGTSVTTDILAFRKKTGTPFDGAQPFLNRAEVGMTPEGAPLRANEYFATHPEMALGEHSTAGTMYSKDDYALVSRPGQDTGALLDQAVDRLPENVLGGAENANNRTSLFSEENTQAAQEGQREGSTQRDANGDFKQVQNGTLTEAPWLTKRNFGDKTYDDPISPDQAAKRRAVADDWLSLRDAARNLLDAENDPRSGSGDLAPLRQALNRAYDRYEARWGKLNRREGQQHLERARFLEDDPDYALVQSLEDEKRDAQGRRPVAADGREIYDFQKGKIFRDRIRTPKAMPEKANNMADAVSISLGYHGGIDPAVVARLMGTSPEDARRQIVESGRAFENPATGNFETRERYLSGNVREKLAAAERAAEDNPALRPNVEALRKVLPETIPSHQIFVQLGSRWVPNEVYRSFVGDVLKSDAQIRYVPELNRYSVRGGRTSPEVLTTFGTSDLNGFDLLQHALDGTEPTITRTQTLPDGSKQTFTDQPATAAAREKLARLKREFESWTRTSESTPDVAGHGPAPVGEHLERSYNTANNGMVAPQYDGSYLTLPGVTDTVRRLPHRLSVVARILQEGSAMMAHGVGSGKTFSQIVGASEMKRLGLSKKPLIVVQKATLGQFAASYRQAYPDARLLVANEKDFSAVRRARFLARVATGDHDAVIITQPQFDRIPNHPDTVRRYFEEKIDQLEDAIRLSREQNGQRDPTTKQLETAKRNLETKMARRLRGLESRQDNNLHFEELGVDSLWIDEAHAYKKVPIVTNKKNVKGIPNDDSQRAIGLEMKVRHVQDKNNGRNVVLATGTPITNSIAEAYVMLKLATPHVLNEYGIRNFDDFANTFGQTQSKLEYSWAGKWKNVTRFNKFANGPELVTMIRSGFDVKMGNKALGLKVPEMKGGGPQVRVVPQTPAMGEVSQLLDRVADAYDAAPDKRELSYVPIVTMQAGMAGALDPRLIDPRLPDDAGSKVNTALRNVLRIHQETAKDRSTQMVFADRFKPMDTSKLQALLRGDKSGVKVESDPEESAQDDNVSGASSETTSDADDQARAEAETQEYRAGGFNLYRDMKAKLIAAGIPEHEVGIIHDYNTDRAREKLFDDINAGTVRVLLGSTEKMGVGVNAQKRLIAIHHLDPPRMMTPAMMEQRDGRIIRQGNDNAEVENIRYGVERSMDTAIYQMLEDKQRFISQALGGILNGRSFDDAADEVTLSMSQMKALTSGDPRVIRRAEVEARLHELNASRAGFEGERSQLSRRLAGARLEQRALAEQHIPAARRLSEVLPGVLPADPDARKAMSASLDETFARLGEQVTGIGSRERAEQSTNLNGLPVKLTAEPADIGRTAAKFGYQAFPPDEPNARQPLAERSVADGSGMLQSIGAMVRNHPAELRTLERQHADLAPQIAEMERAAGQGWEHADEHRRLQEEHSGLNQALLNNSDKEQKPLLSQRSQPAEPEPEEHPIDSLLSLLSEGTSDAVERNQQRSEAEKPGERTVGRPDLAFGNASDAHRAVDQTRAVEHIAQTQAQWNAEAERRYTSNPRGEADNLARKAMSGDQLDAVETKIAQRAVADELAKPDSPEQRRKVQAMIYGYRMTGTEQARAMAARFDPHQTPVQRNREFLGRMIYTPPPEIRAKLEALPKGDAAGRQALLDADQQRVSRIEGELKKMGVTLDDIFRGEIQLRLKGHKIIDNTAGELFDGARQRALKLLQGGARSFADVASAVGLKEGDVKAAYNQMREALRAKLRDKVRRGATAENLDMQPALLSQKAGGPNGEDPVFKSDAETDAELDRILQQMGFIDPAKVGKMRVRQPKKAIFRPPTAPADPAQFEAWKRGGVGDDVRSKVPVGQRNIDFGELPPTGTGERADGRFIRERGDEQGRIDFADQEPARGGGTGERAGGKFLQDSQGKLDVDDGPPVMSGLDLTDPVVATRLSRAIQSADSNIYDKMFEYWSATLLSGPQTHVAIGLGNMLNAGFEFTVQRGMESLLNLAYHDPNAAQLGEMPHILKGLLPGLQRGLSVGLKSFQAEASMFEPTFLDQQMALDPGEHMNAGHKVAIGGKLGKIVRLPFRAVGFLDGFMKTSIFHMEVGAQAYRMAKAEGLTGEALSKRMDELSAPGGEAAVRAVTRATEMIGQAPYLADKTQARADAHSARVDAAYRQARAEGKTGDDITDRATELLRAPDTGGWRRFVPPGLEHNPLDVAMDKFHEMARSTKLLSYAFPYLKMPYNLMKMGLRKSPLGVVNVAARLINAGMYKLHEGRPIFESYPAALQTRHLAEQALAWTAAAALYNAVEGDGEDDRKKRFLITGSRSFKEDKQGQRDLLERTSGGAMTLRVGDTTINYGRYEPIATVLATAADAIRSLKAMGNGASKQEAADKFVGYVTDQVMAKSMLQGMADLQRDIAGGAGTADRAKRALMTALVPNIIRQPLRNLDDYVRDSHGAPAPYSFFPAGGFAESKQTPYGQPVQKTSNPLTRILFPAASKPAERLNNADRLLMNWNAKHPEEAWAPEPLSRKKPDPKTGKDTDMSNEEYAALERRAALKLSMKLASTLAGANASHPTEEDLVALKKAFIDAHREAKEEAFGSKKNPVPVAPLPKPAPKRRDLSTMMGWN